MEREREQSPERQDIIALETMDTGWKRDQIVGYRPDGGIDIFKYKGVGSIAVRSFRIGDDTYSFEYEESRPKRTASFDSWSEYVEARGVDVDAKMEQSGVKLFRGNAEHEALFDEIRDMIIGAAIEKSSHLENFDTYEQCAYECNDGTRTIKCSCVDSTGSSYTDINGVVTSEEKKAGEPRTDCSECGGVGTRFYRCYNCLGSGKTIVNPYISIINNSTNERTTFRIDAISLLANGNTDLLLQNEKHQYYRRNGQPKSPQLRMTIDIEDFMRQKALEVGIDTSQDKYTTYWGPQPLETFGTTFGHFLQQLQVDIDHPDRFESMTDFTDAALRAIQKRLQSAIRTDIYGLNPQTATPSAVREKAQQEFDIEFNEDMTVGHVGIRLDNQASAHVALRDTISLLDRYGLRLGYGVTGIATGETGPALYLIDEHGTTLQEISCGYSEQTVLEATYLKVKQAHENGDFLQMLQ